MAEKFLTTERKKMLGIGGVFVAGYYALSSGSNPLHLPLLYKWITDPLLGGFSLITVAGALCVLVIWMLLFDY